MGSFVVPILKKRYGKKCQNDFLEGEIMKWLLVSARKTSSSPWDSILDYEDNSEDFSFPSFYWDNQEDGTTKTSDRRVPTLTGQRRVH